MIYVGVVGAETPLAKIVLEQIKQHCEMYRLCFKVDKSYKDSKCEAEYSDVYNALLMLSATVIFDFSDAAEAYENAKVYHDFHVPAIITANIDAEKLDTLKHIRMARSSAPLVVEPNLSVNQLILLHNADQILRVVAPDVEQIALNCRYPVGPEFDIEPYMPLVEHLNRSLGINDWSPKHPACQSSRKYNQQFGFVQLTLERGFAEGAHYIDRYNLEIAIRMRDSSWLALQEKSGAADIWRGLEMLSEYALSIKDVYDGEIKTNMLAKCLRRCWQ